MTLLKLYECQLLSVSLLSPSIIAEENDLSLMTYLATKSFPKTTEYTKSLA